ncbi:type 1 glutamine amidotransferase [Chryseomicrobium sp. FSL W7-1435]|uniref:gamma-glutamyl-gamma-aminobutyrate hydrolase family protein n=1 Tax=Chryseomicrobium sp. FSL W7-1435 TaxID=2921704 RepID=UPI00315A672E
MTSTIIGIVGSSTNGYYQINEHYIVAIERAGAEIRYLLGTQQASWIQACDGFLLTGGGDIDPFFFEEQPQLELGEVNLIRDERELAFLQAVRLTKKPILGICRGMQVLNVAAGGTIIQHLDRQIYPTLLQHNPNRDRSDYHHIIAVKSDSFLADWIQTQTLRVNSFHHQAVGELGDGIHIAATAPDGVIEAIEHPELNWFGVQWHPETLTDCPHAHLLFQQFIQHTKEQKHADH